MRILLSVLFSLLLAAWSLPARAQDEADGSTFDQKTILHEAEMFFGDASASIAKVIEKAFDDHGRPNAYILGSEVGGAIIFGGRIGKGVLKHKVFGDADVHWIGPSIGLDFGGDASKVFVLVYHLPDIESIYKRYFGVDGSFYFVGGVSLNYRQKGEVILAPIRTGVGLRAGISGGYVKFTKRRTMFPF